MAEQRQIAGPVYLDGIHSSGRCAGKFGTKNVFLKHGIPGETVSFIPGKRKQGFRGGNVQEVISASPFRQVPFCRHFLQCGGCPWQHIQYDHQLELKRKILLNALEKYGINTPQVPTVIPSPETLYFRNRMEYTFSSSAFSVIPALGTAVPALGFHLNGEPGKVINIGECYLQKEPSRSICEFVKATALDLGFDFYDHVIKTGYLRSLSIRINKPGEVLVVIGFCDDRPSDRDKLLVSLLQQFPQIVSLSSTVHLSPRHSQLQGDIVPFGGTMPYLFEDVAGYRYRMHASSFFQPNAAQAESIFLAARDWLKLTGKERIYDLYTGVGSIALVMASSALQVTGIEGSPLAIEDARENAALNCIENTVFLTGDILETFTPRFLEENGTAEVIVLDPPRSGTLIEIKKTINMSGAEKVLYLSCNPVSLAFDLKQLTEVYKVTRIQPFDMLPHTHHLETLVLLER